jgi:transcriptional pleiotropic repressor
MKGLLERAQLLQTMLAGIDKHFVSISDMVEYFQEMTDYLAAIFECHVVILRISGDILTQSNDSARIALCPDSAKLFVRYQEDQDAYHRNFLALSETLPNISVREAASVLLDMEFAGTSKEIWSVVPVYSGNKRVAHLILYRYLRPFTEAELVMIEYGALFIAWETLRVQTNITASSSSRPLAAQTALHSLTESERKGIIAVFRALNANEGYIVSSKIAAEQGIARSVVVSALHKLAGAKLIESKSLGVKGTYIKVLNEFLLTTLNIN